MSDDTVIAGVSDTLKALLDDRMNHRVTITVGLPDFKAGEGAMEVDSQGGRVNLFLYRITENTSLKNEDLPGRGHPSSYGHPPLYLDLHYLLTASGRLEGDVAGAQENLGEAMRIIHENPVITDQLLMINDNEPHKPVLNSRFQGRFEPLKIYLVPMTLDDISKLWTALTLPYRLSVAYMVSLVQIEDLKERRLPRAVGEPPPEGPRLYVLPMSVPQIRDILVHRQGDQPGIERLYPYARIGDTLIIRGSGFSGSSIRAILGSIEAKIISQKDDRLEVEIPDDSRLHPGAQLVRVLRDIEMGEPPVKHTGFTSNQSVFMLVPYIAPTKCTASLKVAPRTIKITGSRLFWSDLPGETLVGRTVATNYIASSEKEIEVLLSDAFPASSAKCLLSGEIPNPFPNLPDKWELTATCGKSGPYDITRDLDPVPKSIEEAAKVLQTTLHMMAKAGPPFKNLNVNVLDNHLILVPGGRDENDAIHFGNTDVSKALLLTLPMGAAEKNAYISGKLEPFPRISTDRPAVNMTVTVMPVGAMSQATSSKIQLDNRPVSLEEAAVMLQKAIRGVGYGWAFVTTIGDQLLILLNIADKYTVEFDSLPGVDERSASELQLKARYPVRVRVNGAESIDESFVTMP